LTGLGFVIVAIQLLILYQLSRHTTVVDVSSDLKAAPLLDSVQQKQQSHFMKNGIHEKHPIRESRPAETRKPDGTFNGIHVYYTKDATEDSTVSCVGENYQDNAYMYRSCHFTHFCFDTESKDYVLFQSPQEEEWTRLAGSDSFIGTSTTMANMTVALGGLNPKWTQQVFRKLEWFPTVLSASALSEGYYELPSHYVWVPFHSFAGFNAGHIICTCITSSLWCPDVSCTTLVTFFAVVSPFSHSQNSFHFVGDDFLPIYTLLEMFGMLEEAGMEPLLTRFVMKDGPLWATCDWNDRNKEKCAHLFRKFLPAFGVDPDAFSTTEDFVFKPKTDGKSKYVCAKHGAAGLAMLTDHGVKAHGWEPTDYESTHNMGRGPVLYAFRNFMLQNLQISTQPLNSREAPYKVVFSKFSTQSGKRRAGFEKQLEAVENEFSSDMINATGEVMQTLSLKDQAQMASQAAVWVTSCGGGAVTATFLPRGATAIIYYDPKGSIVRNKPTHNPARLDWDLLNHMSYVRVHWLPTTGMDTPEGLKVLTELIRSELHMIEHQ